MYTTVYCTVHIMTCVCVCVEGQYFEGYDKYYVKIACFCISIE